MHSVLQRVPGGVLASIERAGEAIDLVTRTDDLTDFSAHDPRDTGYSGAYPQIVRGHADLTSNQTKLVKDAYARSAAARLLINKLAADTWAKWITVEATDSLKTRLEEVFRNPSGRAGERPLWWWTERADRLASRDGRSLLYFLLEDATGDPSKPPAGVRGIRHVQVIPKERIQAVEVDRDPKSPTFGQVTHWVVMVNVGSGTAAGLVAVSQRVHAERVVPFVPEPGEDDPWDGPGVLLPVLNYVEYAENMIWAAAEAYFQEARPLLYVRRDPAYTGTFNDASRTEAKAAVATLVNPSAQRPVLNGLLVEVVNGTGTPANPAAHWDIAVSVLAMALNVPKRVLTGDAAGELAAAKEDTRAYAARVGQRREQYAGPVMYSIIDRLVRWNVAAWQRKASVVEFSWVPITEPDAVEQADVGLKRMVTRTGYRRARLPLPMEDAYDEVAEWPEGTEAFPEPQPFGAPAPFPGGDAGESPPGARRVQDRLEARVAAALNRVPRALHALLAKHGGDARLDEEAHAAVLRLGLDEELSRIIATGLEDSAMAGAAGTFADLGAERIFRYIDDTTIREFRTLGREQGLDVQQRLATAARRLIAEDLAAGKSTTDITRHLDDVYGLARVDAARIARTETQRGYNRGSVDALASMGVREVEIVEFPDADNEDPNGPCQLRNGRVVSVRDAASVEPAHPNCRYALVSKGAGDVFSLVRGDGVYRARRGRASGASQ